MGTPRGTPPPLPPLVSAIVVCRSTSVAGINHVATHISNFLDHALLKFWSLPRACALGRDVSLLTRLAARESPQMDKFHRAAVFSNALVHAARRGNLEVVEWLHAYCPTGIASKGVEEAARSGQLEVLKWVLYYHQHYHHTSILWTTDFMDAAAAGGHVHILEWLYRHSLSPGCTHDAMEAAARNGCLDAVKWLYRHGYSGTKRAFEDAVAHGHLKIVQFLLEHKHPSRVCPAMDYAARNGHLHVLEWLHANMLAECTSDAMDFAAQSGHLHIVKWLHENRVEGCTLYAMDAAAEHGHLEIVQWLHENRGEGCTRAAMDYAAKEGHLEIVQWLHTHRTEGCTSSAMDGAAGNGHFEVVQWLHNRRIEGCTSRAVDNAAGNGHLHIALWLHEERGVEFTPSAMNLAAANGHLEIVQWLHENHWEGCTTEAMDMAASHNHLHIVQWLHENRSEGSTTRAIDWAVSNDHVEMVRWLFANRLEGHTQDALDEVCSVEMLQLLHELGVPGYSVKCIRTAISQGDFARILFLQLHQREGFEETLRRGRLTLRDQLEVFHWLHENHRKALHIRSIRTSRLRVTPIDDLVLESDSKPEREHLSGTWRPFKQRLRDALGQLRAHLFVQVEDERVCLRLRGFLQFHQWSVSWLALLQSECRQQRSLPARLQDFNKCAPKNKTEELDSLKIGRGLSALLARILCSDITQYRPLLEKLPKTRRLAMDHMFGDEYTRELSSGNSRQDLLMFESWFSICKREPQVKIERSFTDLKVFPARSEMERRPANSRRLLETPSRESQNER